MDGTRSCIKVDLGAIAHNTGLVRQAVGPDTLIMAVIKKNAYGHGIVRMARTCVAAGADRLAVAQVDSVSLLREAGIDCDVHLLGPPLAAEMDECVKHGAVAAITDIETAEALDDKAAQAGKRVKGHLLVDTGMGRLGPSAGDATELACRVEALEHVDLEGAFTHFHSSDDTKKCAVQLNAFLDFVERARGRGVEIPILHAAACGAVWRMPEAFLDMVRVGLCIPGVRNDEGMVDLVTFRPAMTITSTIAFVKNVPEGSPISYGNSYITKRPTVVATIPFGYGNGYHFGLTNRGWVGVNGRKACVLGRVTMDYIMVDVTDIPDVGPGTKAAIIGAPGPTVEELAQLAEVVAHEILCSLGQHSPQEIEYTD
ncbi:alanine racemase [Planctomycetota bacterium]